MKLSDRHARAVTPYRHRWQGSPQHLVVLAALTSCTTLGPMPATTGVSAIPAERDGVELQAGTMPGFHLSDAANERTDGELAGGDGLQQLAAVVEFARGLGQRGLVLGARSWGHAGDGAVEPMLGIRRRLDPSFALAAIGYGTRAHGADHGASYDATRIGGELAIDATLIRLGSWLAVHGQASVSATWLDATGSYCVGGDGAGVDCDDGSRRVDGAIRGVYTAAIGTLAVDVARRPTGVLHGIRLALITAIGGMPRIRDGQQLRSDDRYRSIGLTLTVGLGRAR